ncbi:MAG: hypothetical protein ABUT39_25120 [Acidobacteriota bacterium]
MSLKLSLEEILRNLEQQVAFHREQAALHARQEELHRDQRVLHEAELEKASRHLESLKTVAVPASEAVAPAAPVKEDMDVGPNPTLTALIARILEGRTADEPFGAKAMTAEINRRFRQALGRDADLRSVSAALRRMNEQGRIKLVREGAAVREGLYAKR